MLRSARRWLARCLSDRRSVWKAAVMNREINLEEIDTAAFTDRYGKAMRAKCKRAERSSQPARVPRISAA